jgi:hypothetical protein
LIRQVVFVHYFIIDLKLIIMSKEKEPKEKSSKKEPLMNLKEKRAAKAAKRDGKKGSSIITPLTGKRPN